MELDRYFCAVRQIALEAIGTVNMCRNCAEKSEPCPSACNQRSEE